MKNLPWKIATAALVAVLIMAVALWIRGFRQPTPNPDAPSFADSIRESQRRADLNADSSQKHDNDYETGYQEYNDWRGSSSARDSLGARIEQQAKADSLRRSAP